MDDFNSCRLTAGASNSRIAALRTAGALFFPGLLQPTIGSCKANGWSLVLLLLCLLPCLLALPLGVSRWVFELAGRG